MVAGLLKKILPCVLVAIVFICIIVNYRTLLTGYARAFSVQNASPGADALVVLGGRIESRFPRTLELYNRGYAKKILLTDLRPYACAIPDFDCGERAIAAAMRDYFEPGAPLEIVPSRNGTGAVSTFDEAWDLLRYSRAQGYARLIIVTDEFHTRRSLYAFRKIFKDSGIVIEVMGASNDVFDASSWWQSDAGLKAYLLEPALFVVYLFTDANVPFLENY